MQAPELQVWNAETGLVPSMGGISTLSSGRKNMGITSWHHD